MSSTLTLTRSTPNALTLGRVFAIGAMVLIVLGTKLIFVQAFGSAVPYWDQWDAEADRLYRDYLNSSLSLATLISAHNEHRLLATRIYSLALFELKGGWDPILQMVANAALHVSAIVLLVTSFQRVLPRVSSLPFVLFSILVFALPFGWVNLLSGFQSQFYFVLIFSLLALRGFATSAALSWRWWTSLLCSVAAYFSLASGALTVAAALAVLILQMILGTRRGPREYVAAWLLLTVSVVMIFYVPHVEGHDSYRAQSMSQFLTALLQCLSYPRSASFSGLWVNLPLFVYACVVTAARPAWQSPHWIILSLIVWVFAQAVSLSYGRAVAVMEPRYLDLFIIALPLNFGVLLLAASRPEFNQKRTIVMLAGVVWLFIVLPALIKNTVVDVFPAVLQKEADGKDQRTNVVAYLQTGDAAMLQGKATFGIPYPNAARLAQLLSDPAIRVLLPEAIRPRDVHESELLDRTWLRGKLRSATAWLEAFLLKGGPSMVGFGLALALAAGGLLKRVGMAEGSNS
jgi:hypothetical protein